MDGKIYTEKVKNPREKANPLSVLTFSWILRTFWLGYKRDLEVSDLYKPLKEHTSSILGEKITSIWQAEFKRLNKIDLSDTQSHDYMKDKGDETKFKEPSLLRVLIKCFGAKVMMYGILLAVMEIVLRVMQPLFLFRFLRYYRTDNTISYSEAYLYAFGIIMCSAINIFVVHPYMMAILHMGMKMRVACCTLIYRKALRLSKTALGETTIGQAVNLLSNDVNRFDLAIIFVHYLWIGPLETIIITYFMYQEVGVAAIIGVATLLMFIPLQGFLGKKSSVLRLRTAIRTDERVRLTNEIITGIQAIKMYTWEKPFSALIEKARKKEINVIRATSYIRGVIMSFIMFSTRLSLFITVLAYVLYGNRITAEIVFMLTAYYNILRQTMTVFFPQGITQIAEAIVSIKRLQKFMRYDEISERKIQKFEKKISKIDELNNDTIFEKTEEHEGSVLVKNGCARWLESDKEDTLHGINLHVKPNQLVAIVGQVGSGKSSLLNVILKELPLNEGYVQVKGSIAYASQEPWLFAGSVRQNILFGRKYDQFRYDKVIKECQLKRDFHLLPYGDRTVVGERGISLSGGQRARINLARAVYAEADIYLLDDPLSAVDAHVGKRMFEDCIDRYLRGKTRILVTHQLQYLKNVDHIIVLKDGIIQAEGTFQELIALGIDFGQLLESQSHDDTANSSVSENKSISRQGSISSISSCNPNDSGKPMDPEEVEETRTKGNVGGWVYGGYFRAGGNWCVIFFTCMLFILAQLAASGGDYFIAFWVNVEEKSDIIGKEVIKWNGPFSRDICIYIFSVLTILTVTVTLMRSFSFFVMCMRASKKLHDTMFRCISRATMRFFNTNSSGRVLNRFSKDMGAIDEILPSALIDCVQIGLSLLGIIVVVAISNYLLLIPTVIIGIIFYYLRVFYLATSRSVKRLEGVTRSPVFGHLNATLQGMTTIRAFQAEEILTKEFDHHQDLHSSAWFIFIASSRAFGFWLDIFCLLYIALVTLSFLVLGGEDTTDGGSVGLAITQSIGLTGMFQWGMRQSAELENQMTSVERVLEYSKIESEPALESKPDKKPKEEWPEAGKIEFKQVYLRYAPEEPPVLKNLNFIINSREKIGIVGRTGAGKSSLISALFRLANIEGRVEIDGIETGEIGLHDLRSKISIIPQEPFLFAGSMRKNLDPFDTYPDNVLWQALEEVELKEIGLETHINEGGSNLSVGQRQLVCLARAIARNNPILILDEATANVDLRTDELIQKTIRTKFEKCTVLTIAHRLNTVMDSDRILVMDAGIVVEFDHPHMLLQKPNSVLKSMVYETGNSMAEALKAVAKKSFDLQHISTPL
ncbi:probable multidrug resistance-associated protein lethal(2)03659 [Leptopilina boulardi]|uniref:probable multidrug resistance-associated protein lethal(2)03659 n=1 Tax=Leptopilina boulardi TaxID=63433 RepID=UPI0021F51B0D|nr:probable multidrug resistance-associated protein lethal(2)03659 [Leptopilina boulardi]